MSKKRKASFHDSSPGIYDDASLKTDPAPPPSQAKVDPTYGQRSALPCLDDQDNDPDSVDAIAYLKQVRYFAISLHQSHLLTKAFPDSPS